MPDGHLRLRAANLLRLLGLFGHGHRHRPAAGIPLPEEFRRPLQVGDDHRILAAVAYLALVVAARLPLHLAGRQPQGPHPDLRQPAADDAVRRTVARRGRALHPLGRTPRRGAGPAQTVDVGRSGRQGHRGPDALVEPCGGHLPHVQHRLLRMADVPRRVDADRSADAAPDFREFQRPDDSAGAGGLCRRLRADRRGLRPPPASGPGGRPGAADRGPRAAGAASGDGRGDDLVRHADQIQRHTAVYLFPILRDRCTTSTINCFST